MRPSSFWLSVSRRSRADAPHQLWYIDILLIRVLALYYRGEHPIIRDEKPRWPKIQQIRNFPSFSTPFSDWKSALGWELPFTLDGLQTVSRLLVASNFVDLAIPQPLSSFSQTIWQLVVYVIPREYFPWFHGKSITLYGYLLWLLLKAGSYLLRIDSIWTCSS